jgi:hypothetical protein
VKTQRQTLTKSVGYHNLTIDPQAGISTRFAIFSSARKPESMTVGLHNSNNI